jgi:hypothetical protein
MRLEAAGDLRHLVGRGHFQVHRRTVPGADALGIFVPDMPAILAQMDGDAVRPRRHGRLGHGQRVRMHAPARVAQGRDVVDVDA